MTQEAKVRVRLDTSLAKQDLQGLVTGAQHVAGRIGGGIRDRLGAGVMAAGGNIAGRVEGAARSLGGEMVAGTTSGITSAARDLYGMTQLAAERAIFGNLGAEARATEKARAWLAQTFAYNVQSEADAARLKPMFEERKKIMQRYETGADIINSDPRFSFAQKAVNEVNAKLIATVVKTIREVGDTISSALGR